jgi:hypothetical protein
MKVLHTNSKFCALAMFLIIHLHHTSWRYVHNFLWKKFHMPGFTDSKVIIKLKHKDSTCTAAMLFYILPKIFLERVTYFSKTWYITSHHITSDLNPRLNSTSACIRVCPPLYSSLYVTNVFSPPMTPHVPYGFRGPPSRLWPKCNRLLRLGHLWGAVTLSRWGGWWYMNMKYQDGP